MHTPLGLIDVSKLTVDTTIYASKQALVVLAS
jgi:hypothetical protein